jgi:predicted molibdopterin-dependent oxidoreductase YjgC
VNRFFNLSTEFMESLFRILPDSGAPRVTIRFDGEFLSAPAGISVAAALLTNGIRRVRATPASGAPRAPYCMMGVCFDCLVEIDGVPNQQSCLTSVCDGMQVRSQEGARELGVEPPAYIGSTLDDA